MKDGSGVFTINNRNFDDYFTREVLKKIIQQPLEITNQMGKFDFYINVGGGGICRSGRRGQTGHLQGAVRGWTWSSGPL